MRTSYVIELSWEQTDSEYVCGVDCSLVFTNSLINKHTGTLNLIDDPAV